MDTLPFLRPRPTASYTERLRNVFLASQQKPMPFFTYKFTRLLTSEIHKLKVSNENKFQ